MFGLDTPLFPSFFIRTIKLSEIPKLLVDAAVMTTIVMLIIGASSVLSFVMSFTGLPGNQ